MVPPTPSSTPPPSSLTPTPCGWRFHRGRVNHQHVPHFHAVAIIIINIIINSNRQLELGGNFWRSSQKRKKNPKKNSSHLLSGHTPVFQPPLYPFTSGLLWTEISQGNANMLVFRVAVGKKHKNHTLSQSLSYLEEGNYTVTFLYVDTHCTDYSVQLWFLCFFK